jgi:hypothetical protein
VKFLKMIDASHVTVSKLVAFTGMVGLFEGNVLPISMAKRCDYAKIC